MPSSTSSAAVAPAPTAAGLWEKSDTVLWAFTPEGIVLHNFSRRLFVELDAAAHLVWSYLDGVHRSDEIADLLLGQAAYAQMSRAARLDFVERLTADLAEGGFVRTAP